MDPIIPNEGMSTNEATANKPKFPGMAAPSWDVAKLEGKGPDELFTQWFNAKQALAALRDTKNIETEIIVYGNACADKVPGLARLDAAPATAGGARGPKRESASVEEITACVTKLIAKSPNGVKTGDIEADLGKSIGAALKKAVEDKHLTKIDLGRGKLGGNIYKPAVKAPEKASQGRGK